MVVFTSPFRMHECGERSEVDELGLITCGYQADERIVEVESDLDKTALDTCSHHVQGVVLISVLVITSGSVFIL